MLLFSLGNPTALRVANIFAHVGKIPTSRQAHYAKAAGHPLCGPLVLLVHVFTALIDKKISYNIFQKLNPNSFLDF